MAHASSTRRRRTPQLDTPSLRAVPFLAAAGAEPIEILSHADRQQLARIATVQTLPARAVVYRAGAPARSLFIIGSGAVKSFRDLPSGRRRIVAFLFARDMFGLAEAGHYVNTVQTMMTTRVYELELHALTELFKQASTLEMQFLCKTIHTLREAQHHTIIVGRRDAIGRVAMLLGLLRRQLWGRIGPNDILIPMSRSDMASYLGLSLEAVVRASRRLEMQGIVRFADRHHARILDHRRFEELADRL